MSKGRLEAFSDGVIAIIITIMVLELAIPSVSVFLYAIAVPLAFANRWLALGLYVAVAVMWLIPDRRIERTLA